MVTGKGWPIYSEDRRIWRFHRDQKGWINEPKVFIDRGFAYLMDVPY